MNAPDPLTAYYSTEYHRRNMQVANVCGAKAAVDQALERALTVKSIPVWLIAYLESAANRLPGISDDLAAWRDVAPDAPEHVRRATPDPLSDPRVRQETAYNSEAVKALVELLREASDDLKTYVDADWPVDLRAQYPSCQRKWERDMELCNRIDTALRAIEEGGDD